MTVTSPCIWTRLPRSVFLMSVACFYRLVPTFQCPVFLSYVSGLRPCINYLFKCVIRNHFRRVRLFWLPVFRGTVYLSGEGVAAEMWGSWTRGRELDRNWALAVKSWGPWPTTPSNALLPKQVPFPSKPASPTGDEVLKHLSLWGHCTLKPEEAPDTSRHRVIIAHFL